MRAGTYWTFFHNVFSQVAVHSVHRERKRSPSNKAPPRIFFSVWPSVSQRVAFLQPENDKSRKTVSPGAHDEGPWVHTSGQRSRFPNLRIGLWAKGLSALSQYILIQ